MKPNHLLTIFCALFFLNINAQTFTPVKRVVIEELTGTWCGWCPRGAVYADSLANMYPNTTEIIAVHNNSSGIEPMVVGIYDTGATSLPFFGGGFPAIEVDRLLADDPTDIFTHYYNHINDFGLADITVTVVYDTSTRIATVNATAHFAQAVNGGGYNLALVITEDSVHNNSSPYDQDNYYSFQAMNMPLTGAGHNWQAEPNPVPAADMYYNHVARTIDGTYLGTNGSLPSTIAAGAIENYSFTYTVPLTSYPEQMKAIILLININTSAIMNANHAGLTSNLTGVSEAAQKRSAHIYPNPLAKGATLQIDKMLTDASLAVYNSVGELVQQAENISGNTIPLNKDLPGGLYFICVKQDGNTVMGGKLIISN
ncbi:MAG TPA: T9SS type A sorting domain-containing protein [Bacteroidia bacterium]|nr:T9SS type A sorting domain-containing protein [Bacteroidia bacterium]